MGETILYETVVAIDDSDGYRFFETEVFVSLQEMLALLSDDKQASRAVMSKVIGSAHAKILQIRLENCSVCAICPAARILGVTAKVEAPSGHEPYAKIYDYLSIPICAEPTCVRHAARRCKREQKEIVNRIQAAALRVGCHCCGKAETADGPQLMWCGQCKAVCYCSRSCQKAEWPSHKKFCSSFGKRWGDLISKETR